MIIVANVLLIIGRPYYFPFINLMQLTRNDICGVKTAGISYVTYFSHYMDRKGLEGHMGLV